MTFVTTALPNLRVGTGFDAHRFADPDSGKPLYVAGLKWEGVGIEGDSDGDIAVHALIDALLSAAGLGDIGSLFGVGVNSNGAGMHGLAMLSQTVECLDMHACKPVNASVTIIGNRPKIGKRRAEAIAALSQAAGCPISVSATTTDGMGFTGDGTGIAAIANALVVVGEPLAI